MRTLESEVAQADEHEHELDRQPPVAPPQAIDPTGTPFMLPVNLMRSDEGRVKLNGGTEVRTRQK